MRNLFIVLIAAISLTACDTKSSVKKFTVKGTIHNNSAAKKIYLEEMPMTTMQRIVVDSASIGSNGKFELSTGATESRAYTVRIDQQQYPLVALINDDSPVTIYASYSKEYADQPDSVSISGSKASNDLKDYMLRLNEKLQQVFAYLREGDTLSRMQNADSSLQLVEAKIRAGAADAKQITSLAIDSSQDAALTMVILGYYQSTANQQGLGLTPFSNEEVKRIIDQAAARNPDHQSLAAIKGKMDGWVGKPAPDFTLPDPTGKQISLSSFKGKYVLVDFWASWCKPCRDENPNLVQAYNKYKDKNFTILGVSLDRPGAKDAWMNAVMKDNLTWTQLSDLQEWNSPVVAQYGFGETGIPYNILVDPEGKIIAERLRGADLDAKLQEVLK